MKLFNIPVILFYLTVALTAQSQTNQEKPKILWFDSEANFERFSSKDSICYYLDLTKKSGFNEIVVDVRPIQGDVLYKSKILEPLTTFGDGHILKRKWDYLAFFIKESKKRGLKVNVSASIMPAGLLKTKSGPAYRDSKWKEMIAIGNTPTGLKAMTETDYIGIFLNPNLESVQKLVNNYVHEIVKNYDFDGFILDYCRFADSRFDFSDSSKIAFEKYIGKKIEKFPDDIFVYDQSGNKVAGKYYKEWWEFRAHVIQSTIERLRNTVKKEKPNVKLGYWAASWIHGIYGNGQNWASKGKFEASKDYPEWATPNYKNTGFADHLDFFMVGAYLQDIYGLDNNESIEFALNRAKGLIAPPCHVIGSIYGEANKQDMENAVYLTLRDSEGLMVFDIVQVINYNQWKSIKNGIEKYENESPSTTLKETR